MAATSSIYKRQLSLSYASQNAKGKQVTKSINLKNINTDATLDDLYSIANEISKLLSVSVTAINTVDNSKLNA